ncbi:ATP-dependent Clp protease ATP-binding subunit [Terrilactibacillus laevilacticus]|uniref:AAA family ATPase n=1 Tax=Terrilactibacillus laevilacticus TaxID=1380157 RepID=A0ABW5PQ86_9BACI|nr:ATP-dependent Clp protease ATP-binding subunit [Terrilactibacillus laevilacticus]
MKCNNCNVNPAVIEMNIQVNGKLTHLNLCEDCYKKLRNEMKIPTPFGGGFEDMINQFMQPSMAFNMMGHNGLNQEQPKTGYSSNHRGGLLDELGNNITDAARKGLIDPVVGREKEVEQVIETLNRRTKNNPVLIGEPGVGKTAIAEGLALKIVEGRVPAKLSGKEVYLLDVSSLVANTGIRGQFEERMKQLINELRQRKNVIVFIDEVHQLVGAGSAEGSMDAGNILKPALARGELQIIGATTLNEYRQIEKDSALERRFQPIMVNEPSKEQAIKILQGIQSKYERYHDVKYTDEAIRACVTLSDRYIQDRFLPDKAIDLMDEAGSKVNLMATSQDESSIKEKLEKIKNEKTEATKNEEYERAAKLRDEENALMKQLEEAEGEQHHSSVVDVDMIEQIIENRTGIPVRKLQQDEQNKMVHLADEMNKKVIGQKEAVEKVARAIRRNRTGFRRGSRPIGSFLFVGPTGVGKTELAKTLAEEMFGDQEAMIRLDMSEYMEKHAVSKLIGSPPGYIGHDEAGQLTERIRRKPYSILLLDEIEKAHPDILHLFLQILDDGRLTDSQGRTVSFKDTVIIMTSNAGVLDKTIKVGFGGQEETKPNILDNLSSYFKPEFLNRLDGIISFNQLTKQDLEKIVDLLLEETKSIAAERGLDLVITDQAKQKLAELGYNPIFGARPLRRVIEEKVEAGISDVLLENNQVKTLIVDVLDNDIHIKTE